METVEKKKNKKQVVRSHQIVEGWEVLPLEKLTDPKRPISYGIVQTGPNVEAGIRCVRVIDLKNGIIDDSELITTTLAISNSYKRTILKTGDLVIALRGKIGEVAYVSADLKGANLTRGVALIAANDKINSIFLKFQLSSPGLIKILEKNLNGSALQEISIGVLRRIPVLYPTNLTEQQKIAQILTAWDKAIATTEKLIAAKEQHKKALMQQLLTGKKRFKEFKNSKRIEVKLGDIFTERNESGYNDLQLLSITSKGGVIKRDELDKKDTSNQDKSKYKRIVAGDIGYNTMRMWQGVSSLSPYEGIVSPAYTIVTPSVNIDGLFMSYLFKFTPVIHLFHRHSQGLVDDTLNCKYPHFAMIKVTIPGKKEEQQEIARVLSACDADIKKHKEYLQALQRQKKGLMQQLLTGKKRVKLPKEN